MAVPNAIRIALAVASAASFLPQYYRIISRRSCEGISPSFILQNLIVATHNFTMGLIDVLYNGTLRLRDPPSLGEVLNFVQVTAVFGCHLILFAFILFFPSSHSARTLVTVVSIYALFIIITLAPIVFIYTVDFPDKGGPLEAFSAAAAFIWKPLSSVLVLTAPLSQVRLLQMRTEVGSLSKVALLFQGVVFLAVGISWADRMNRTYENHGPFTWVGYMLIGFIVWDNVIFAVAQLVLWLVARHKSATVLVTDSPDETSPLLDGS